VKAYSQTSENVTWAFGSGREPREQIRSGTRALVKFESVDGQGIRHEERAFTWDISSSGMFIFSDSLPPEKADLQVEFFGCIAGADSNLEVTARTLVLRVESAIKPGSPGGFAVFNRSYSLAEASIPDPEGDPRNAPN
jgi:hypothetical protein